MVFFIFMALLFVAVVFFHYVQGFFSATLSAVMAVISAAVAIGYYETLIEGPLAGMSPNWMPALLIMGLFAVTYVVLRTVFDKIIPGQISLPAALDKVGGAMMGAVAGVFGIGVVAIAAQQLPLGPALAGYARYEVSDKVVTVPPQGAGSRARNKDASTFDEVVAQNFDHADAVKTKMLIPFDDIVVGTIAHLSDGGALNAGKPLTSIHPDLLQELFAQRLGIEVGGRRTVTSTPDKPAVEVTGVYFAPTLVDSKIVDHEYKKVRGGTPIKVPAKVSPGEKRVVLRVKFNDASKEEKVSIVRLSPGAIRLVGLRPNELTGDPEPHNYYPIGTMDPGGMMYVNKIDDFLFIKVPAQKFAGGGDGPAEVDFVYQVKEQGLLLAGDKPGTARFAPGTFLEVKKGARVDLGEGDAAVVKASMPPVPVLAIMRKHLEYDGGPKPSEPGQVAVAAVAAPAEGAAAAAPAGGGGGGHLGQRLLGTWEARTGVQVTDVVTFTADGGMDSTRDGQLRWSAGNPQGEALDITVTGGDSPGKRSINFLDDNSFDMTGTEGNNLRYRRQGDAPAPVETPAAAAPSQANDPNMAKMVGAWENGDKFVYTFNADGTYAAAQGERSNNGTWRVTAAEQDGNVLSVELVSAAGRVNPTKWNVSGAAGSPAQLQRLEPASPTPFVKK